eukprot:scaffold114618_cov75-Phaeocystis_antarctica.AAC.1
MAGCAHSDESHPSMRGREVCDLASHEDEELVWEIHEGNDRLIRRLRGGRRSQARAAPLHVWGSVGLRLLSALRTGRPRPSARQVLRVNDGTSLQL